MFWASWLSSGKERGAGQEKTDGICFPVPYISMLIVLANGWNPACLPLGMKAMKLSHIPMRSCWHWVVFFIFYFLGGGGGRGRVEGSKGGGVRWSNLSGDRNRELGHSVADILPCEYITISPQNAQIHTPLYCIHKVSSVLPKPGPIVILRSYNLELQRPQGKST